MLNILTVMLLGGINNWLFWDKVTQIIWELRYPALLVYVNLITVEFIQMLVVAILKRPAPSVRPSVPIQASYFLQSYFRSCGKFPCLVLLIFRHSDVQSDKVFVYWILLSDITERNAWVSRSEEIHLLLALKGPCFLDLMEEMIEMIDLQTCTSLARLQSFFDGGDDYNFF